MFCVISSEAMHWMQQLDNYEQLKESFDSTSRFARLKRLQVRIAGRHLFIRFVATTGDAMGMNMLSKVIQSTFMNLFSLILILCFRAPNFL
jgi:hydroxymethylglutaryl-CoA reductase